METNLKDLSVFFKDDYEYLLTDYLLSLISTKINRKVTMQEWEKLRTIVQNLSVRIRNDTDFFLDFLLPTILQ